MPVEKRLTTDAGYDIVARVFPASDSAPNRGVCVMASATGVAQYLYDDFAHWLAEQGFTAITFDYEGIGLSIERHVKDSKSDILSWAKYDCNAVIDFIKQQYPEQKITWIGHSLGGHVLGFMEDTSVIDRAITVGAGIGTWWYNAKPSRRGAWLLWYLVVPLTVPFFGYFPGDKLNIMCNLPKGVILQWRRWCLKERYAVEHEGEWLRQNFAEAKMPITSVVFTDDDMMSPKSVDMLHAEFTSAPQKRITVSPEDIGQKRIGHIGWHKKRYQTLWESFFLPELVEG